MYNVDVCCDANECERCYLDDMVDLLISHYSPWNMYNVFDATLA